MGWKETREPWDGALVWFINSCKSIDHKLLNYKMCYFNRYPRSGIVWRKRPFQLLIKKYQRFFKNEYDFIPETFVLPDEYKDFTKFLDENKGKMMIAKPSKGRGGEGIFFVKSKKDISKETMKAYDNVLQEYISNPFLIDNKKFDFRLYRIRRCLVPLLNDQNFTKFMRGTRQRWFLFLIFFNFPKFSKILQFFFKSATGGLFYYYGIVFK